MTMSAKPYWARDVATLLRELSSTTDGLRTADVERQRAAHGENRLTAGQPRPVVGAVLAQLRSPLLWLLGFATAISAVLGETTDAIVVASILGLGSLVSILQDARAGEAVARLRERIALRSRVIRDRSRGRDPRRRNRRGRRRGARRRLTRTRRRGADRGA